MNSLTLTKTDYDALNVVALKKMANPGDVCDTTGHDRADAVASLRSLAEQGLIVLTDDDTALPTDEADAALRESASRIYQEVREDASIAALVEKFEVTNSQFLVTMSSWQQLDVGGRKVLNDHSDPDYDEKVISRLGKLTLRLNPLISALAAHDGRFRLYAQRFAASCDRIDAGQHDYVSSPVLDSVHNVWFEFHEDLLRTMGKERSE